MLSQFKQFSRRTKILGALAGGGAAAVFGTLFYLKNRFQEEIQKDGHLQQSLEIMRGYQPVVEYLGEPIKNGQFDMANEKYFSDGLKAHFAFPVFGPKGNGYLYYWCSREKEKDDWTVNKLDFQKGDTRQRWTFYLNNYKDENFKDK